MDQIQTFFGYHHALVQLLRHRDFGGQDKRSKLEALSALCGDLLEVDNVGVWTSGISGNSLSRVLTYRRGLGFDSSACSLSREQHGPYFAALDAAEIISAEDAATDPRTRSLHQGGPGREGIGAVLDAPIFDGRRLGGVIALETGQRRSWTLADISFVTAIADTISLINAHEAWLNSRKELDYITHHDDFTGLLNQRSLRNHIKRLIELDGNAQPEPFALLWIDIDRLNAINNGMGLHVGNEVVSEIAARLRGMLLPGKELVARVGGDEFAMIYRFPKEVGTMHGAVDTILETIGHPIMVGEQKVQVSASIGISFFPYDGNDISTLIRHSESAMYHAKSCGRRQAQYFNQDISASAKARFLLEGQLAEAIAHDGLSVLYQPIVSNDGQRLVGAEALVRWRHDSLGFMSPAEFLPLAYEAGLIAALDQWVLERVCRDIQESRRQELMLPPVAVNLSADAIMDPLLSDKVWALLERYQVVGEQLELEVIEDAIKGDSRALRQTLEELVRMGIKLSIDDFGTGYSSLLRLKSLPFTKLKIDRSFTKELPHDVDDCAITLSILGLAKGLGLEVVAEGVENQEQEAWLQRQGCNYLQGFKYHRPMSIEQFRELLVTA
ncbi:putative bifunctional diguanylate cyclase/phosphodiesterase [Zobellella sp. DQSA1]|uniref:putative bifunctional diguanylate cyclase/phosphodiesterase n=1 Tax=Zobellella sp. DQSA1 TaxID=3342386 RepID=UPI0035BED13E